MHQRQDQHLVLFLPVKNNVTTVLMTPYAIAQFGGKSSHARMKSKRGKATIQADLVTFRLPETESLNSIDINVQ